MRGRYSTINAVGLLWCRSVFDVLDEQLIQSLLAGLRLFKIGTKIAGELGGQVIERHR